ncbi:MAG TPA: hypothetical protein VFD92_22675 [Candidatus Binatia bacterium]|nr:hypothetical protein [Candidatus Binatia bacterium]
MAIERTRVLGEVPRSRRRVRASAAAGALHPLARTGGTPRAAGDGGLPDSSTGRRHRGTSGHAAERRALSPGVPRGLDPRSLALRQVPVSRRIRRQASASPVVATPAPRAHLGQSFRGGEVDRRPLAPVRHRRARQEPTAPSVRLDRPVDLVWRTVRSTPGAPGESPHARAQTSAMPPLPSTASLPARAAEDVRDERTRRAAAAPLDAAVLDRLADDVIRRVERRARIERERRGV